MDDAGRVKFLHAHIRRAGRIHLHLLPQSTGKPYILVETYMATFSLVYKWVNLRNQ